MCLYPKLILNKRYCSTKKNGGIVPPCPDNRLKYVTAACGQCYECRKQKQRQWLVRMNEELKNNPNAYFITLTIDDNNMKKLIKECKSKEENDIAIAFVFVFCIRSIVRMLPLHTSVCCQDMAVLFRHLFWWSNTAYLI